MPISLDSLNNTKKTPTTMEELDPNYNPNLTTEDSTFAGRTGKAVGDVTTSLFSSPGKTIQGGVKALRGGVVDFVESSPQGLFELAAGIGGYINPLEGKTRAESFGEMSSRARASDTAIKDNVNKLTAKITKLNSTPEGKEEESMAELLAVIPDGITSAGDTVYEKTGSAVAGAGSQALLTFLMVKPSTASKVFKSILDSVKGTSDSVRSKVSADKVQTVFDELAVKNPQGARDIANHVMEADPEVGEHLHNSIDKVEEMSAGKEEIIGKKAAEADINEKSVKLYRGVAKGRDPLNTKDTVGGAHFYSPLDSVAETFAGKDGTVIENEVQFKNLLESRDWNGIKKSLKLDKKAIMVDVIKAAKEQGYDGMKFNSLHGVEYAHFPEAAIKTDIRKVKDHYALYINGKPSIAYTTMEAAMREAAMREAKAVASLTPEQAGAGIRESMREGYDTLNKSEEPVKGMEDPVMFMDNGQPVTRGSVDRAFKIGSNLMYKTPGVGVVKGKLSGYYEEAIRLVNPEALGPEAKLGASVLAKNIAEQMQKDSSFFHRAAERRTFWNHRMEESQKFIDGFEQDKKFDDPMLNKASEAYRSWGKEIYDGDQKAGIEYEPVDNYLYHTYEDSEGVAKFLQQRFGPKWNNPGFIKDRSFDMYKQAIAAGFKPKWTNPEDIMLARQHASNVAVMKVNILNDMEKYGLATKVTKGQETHPEGFPSTQWRSPNGNKYWVNDKASAVMHNYFETKGLWQAKGLVGDTFKGAMFLKNLIVPIKLGISLFHPIHVATIDNATAMVRSSKELLSGKSNPAKWMKDMTGAAAYKDFINNPKMGSKILKAYQGKIKDGDLSSADRQSLQYMAEGGMIPEMSSQFKTKAMDNFKSALEQRSSKALFHAPFAALQAIQKPMFEIWIPSLKIASYLKDVQTALKVDPTLMNNSAQRLVAFRRIAKSVDNRYGEMAYNTLFMNRMVKDVAVANTLSLGWQMGFLREYGGGAMDIGQTLTKEGGVATKAKTGMLDRPLFVTYYTTQALVYGGLLTWAMTSKPPEKLMDYVYPKTGDQNEKGEDQRVNTMFYPREFAAISKHIENQGLMSGLGSLAESKSSGLIGMASEWASGVNSFGQEIRDPNAPAYKKLEQTVASTLADLEPISLAAIGKTGGGIKNVALAVAGFTPAPQYATEPKTEALIKSTFNKYYGSKQTPYEKVEYSAEVKKLQKQYAAGDMDNYSEGLDKLIEKYDLTPQEQLKIAKTAMTGKDSNVSMFQRMTWQQQKKILDEMSPEEREIYLPKSNKDHLRYKYESPEE